MSRDDTPMVETPSGGNLLTYGNYNTNKTHLEEETYSIMETFSIDGRVSTSVVSSVHHFAQNFSLLAPVG